MAVHIFNFSWRSCGSCNTSVIGHRHHRYHGADHQPGHLAVGTITPELFVSTKELPVYWDGIEDKESGIKHLEVSVSLLIVQSFVFRCQCPKLRNYCVGQLVEQWWLYCWHSLEQNKDRSAFTEFQHTRELISARKTSYKHNNKDLSRLR